MKPLLALLALSLVGCAAVPTATLAEAGCRSQLSVQDASPLGTLEVHVVDERGVLLPNAAVQVIGPNEQYHLACVPGANAATGGDGVARLERMKVGHYRVSAYTASGDTTLGAQTFAAIEANKATTVTLTVRAIH